VTAFAAALAGVVCYWVRLQVDWIPLFNASG